MSRLACWFLGHPAYVRIQQCWYDVWVVGVSWSGLRCTRCHRWVAE